MLAGLQLDPTIKNSGVSRLGAIPADWRRLKLRQVLSRVSERNRPDLPLLSVVRERGVVLRTRDGDDSNHNFIPDDLTNYKVVRRGQLALNKMKAWQGSYGVSSFDGIVSPAYFVFQPKGVRGVFLHVALRSRPYVALFEQASDGVRIGQWDLSEARMREIPFCVPGEDEQLAIVRFLDHADRRIRRYIRAKQKLITLLEEQKQAIIHRAVTRGLKLNARFRLSSVESVNEVPEHWAELSFSRCAVERADYRGATPTKTDAGIFLVTARNIRKGWIDYGVSKEFVAESEYDYIMRRGRPRRGDVLLTMEAPLGHAALIDREDVALAQRVVRFRFDPEQWIPEFVLHAALSPYFQDQLQRRGTGSTAVGIKASKLPQLRLLCPPVEEQRQILDAISADTDPLTSVATRAAKEIALLREYRSRLVADVVTGKLDVREAAARLPDDRDDVLDEPVEDGEVDAADDAEAEEVEV